MKVYTVCVEKWDFNKGKSVDRDILNIGGKTVADVRKKVLAKFLNKYKDPIGFDFDIYDPLEYTADPVRTKFKGNWVTLGVEKGHGHIYANGIIWYTYNEKTKVLRRYKLDKDGKIRSGQIRK